MAVEEEMSAAVIISIVIGIIIFVLALVLLFLFFFRDKVPCFPKADEVPEGDTPWKHVNRYGETKLMFVSYRLQDVRERKRRKKRPLSSKAEKTYGADVALGYNTEDSINFRDYPEILSPKNLPSYTHMITEELEYEDEKPKKKSRRKKKKKQKSSSPEREPKNLPPLRQSGFKSSAPTSELKPKTNKERRPEEESYLDATYSSPRNGHLKIDSDNEDHR